jgi:hypothetical protein
MSDVQHATDAYLAAMDRCLRETKDHLLRDYRRTQKREQTAIDNVDEQHAKQMHYHANGLWHGMSLLDRALAFHEIDTLQAAYYNALDDATNDHAPDAGSETHTMAGGSQGKLPGMPSHPAAVAPAQRSLTKVVICRLARPLRTRVSRYLTTADQGKRADC